MKLVVRKLSGLARWRREGLIRYALFCGDFGSRLVLQAAYFLFISRLLGPSGFGQFASLTSITALAACFSGLGGDQLIIIRSSENDYDLRSEIGRALVTLVYTLLPVAIITLAVSRFVTGGGVSYLALIAVILSDTIFSKTVSIVSAAFYTSGRIALQWFINVLPLFMRMAAAALTAVIWDNATVEIWCYSYAVSTLVSGLIAAGVLLRFIGLPRMVTRVQYWMDGVLLSMEFASLAAFRDVDKPIVNTTLGSTAAGIYTVAFRVVDMACVPIRAQLQSLYIRYFAEVKKSRRGALRFGARNAAVVALMGVAIGGGTIVVAPLLPRVVGAKYDSAVHVIMLMSCYPVLLGVTAIGSDLLRALKMQKLRLMFLTITYALYVPVIYVGSHVGGISGAALARMAVQALAAVLTWAAVIWVLLRGQEPVADAEPTAA